MPLTVWAQGPETYPPIPPDPPGRPKEGVSAGLRRKLSAFGIPAGVRQVLLAFCFLQSAVLRRIEHSVSLIQPVSHGLDPPFGAFFRIGQVREPLAVDDAPFEPAQPHAEHGSVRLLTSLSCGLKGEGLQRGV
jgi:hypothetical protein